MRPLGNNRGMTLLEIVVAMGILTLLGVGLLTILMQSLRGWAGGAGNEAANSTATTALNRLTYDIREARSAVVSSGQLIVTFPAVLTDPDTNEQIYDSTLNNPVPRSYYVTGGNLVRNVGGTISILRQGVSSATFVAAANSAANSVEITLVSTQQLGASVCTQQATGCVTFRNYH